MTKRVKKRRAPAASRRRAEVLPSGRHAVVGVDPGGTSGLFCGIVEIQQMMKDTALGLEKTWIASHHQGSFREQAVSLKREIKAYFAMANMDGIGLGCCHVVIEDWDTGRQKVGREIISAWIAAGLDVLLWDGVNGPLQPEQVTYQYAAQAKGYATNDKLKLWDLYDKTKGMPHARDASRHWATKVNLLVG